MDEGVYGWREMRGEERGGLCARDEREGRGGRLWAEYVREKGS